jgi:hypothetical protein
LTELQKREAQEAAALVHNEQSKEERGRNSPKTPNPTLANPSVSGDIPDPKEKPLGYMARMNNWIQKSPRIPKAIKKIASLLASLCKGKDKGSERSM